MNFIDAIDGEIFGNSLLRWLIAGAIFLVTFLALRQARDLLGVRFGKAVGNSEASFDRLFLTMINETHAIFFLVLAAYPALLWLTLPSHTTNLLGKIALTAVLFQAGSWGARVVTFFIYRHLVQRRGESKALLSAMHLMVLTGQVIVWTLVTLLILQNLGFNVTALVTGLGISGVAVALAVQSILKDLFASLSIVLDRPFEIGDGIAVGETTGVVERIGLKTTRLRGVNGEELIFSNSALLDAHLRNFRTIREKRHVFTVPFAYSTPPASLRRAIEIVEKSVAGMKDCRLDSCILKSFGLDGVLIEAVYFAREEDPGDILRNQHAIYMAILSGLAESGIEPGLARSIESLARPKIA